MALARGFGGRLVFGEFFCVVVDVFLVSFLGFCVVA